MPITRTRTKYYLLSVLGALVVAVGVLAVAPSAQAQQEDPEPPSIDKECNPNPVQIGQQITCTIDVVAAPGTEGFVETFTDTFPAGIRPTEVVFQFFRDGVPADTPPGVCTVDGQTVECSFFTIINKGPVNPELILSARIIVEATAEQCGTFQNTATATGFLVDLSPPDTPFTVEDTEEITVEGCGGEIAPGGGGTPVPITQEGEQESEAGEIDQSFEVS